MRKNEYKTIILAFLVIILALIYQFSTDIAEANYKDLNLDLVESKMITLVNDYRQENNIHPLVIGSWLEPGATIRAEEMANYGSHRYIDSMGLEQSHTRPDGTSWSIVFEDIQGDQSKPRFLSENIALIMTSMKHDEDYLANAMFTEWKESPGHNEAMLSPENNSFAFKVAKIPFFIKNENVAKGRNTYIGVQIFDTYKKHNN